MFILCVLLGSQTKNPKKCNMIDVNAESSLSASNSNSMISKTPTSVHTLAGDLPKDEFVDTNQAIDLEKVNSNLTAVPGGEYNST